MYSGTLLLLSLIGCAGTVAPPASCPANYTASTACTYKSADGKEHAGCCGRDGKCAACPSTLSLAAAASLVQIIPQLQEGTPDDILPRPDCVEMYCEALLDPASWVTLGDGDPVPMETDITLEGRFTMVGFSPYGLDMSISNGELRAYSVLEAGGDETTVDLAVFDAIIDGGQLSTGTYELVYDAWTTPTVASQITMSGGSFEPTGSDGMTVAVESLEVDDVPDTSGSVVFDPW